MANDPFTIRIFVPDGDPEGVRLIDRMNWTGLGIVLPREKWPSTKQRPEFSRTGVYILTGQTEFERTADDLCRRSPRNSYTHRLPFSEQGFLGPSHRFHCFQRQSQHGACKMA